MALGDILAGSAAPVNPTMGMTAPPQAAGDVEKNKGLWRNFLNQFKDPNFRQALGATGRGLMQTPGYGQNGWDVASTALDRGVATLQALREQDRVRALQEQDRKTREEQRRIENRQKDRTLDTADKNAAIYEQATANQNEASLRSDANTDAQLAEVTRHNKATEANDAIRANADRTRASFYSSGGKDPADVTKIKLLAAEYMSPAYGMDETSAMARATREVELNSKTKDPAGLTQELYKQKVMAYTQSFEGMRNPMTKDMSDKFLNEAITDAMRIAKISDASKGKVSAPTPQFPGQATGVVDRNPTVKNPQTEAQIAAAVARGLPKEKIRSAIQSKGEDPSLYGY